MSWPSSPASRCSRCTRRWSGRSGKSRCGILRNEAKATLRYRRLLLFPAAFLASIFCSEGLFLCRLTLHLDASGGPVVKAQRGPCGGAANCGGPSGMTGNSRRVTIGWGAAKAVLRAGLVRLLAMTQALCVILFPQTATVSFRFAGVVRVTKEARQRGPRRWYRLPAVGREAFAESRSNLQDGARHRSGRRSASEAGPIVRAVPWWGTGP